MPYRKDSIRYRQLRSDAQRAIEDPRNPLLVGNLKHRDMGVLLHDLCYDSSLNGSFLHLSYTESAYPYKFPVGRLSTTAKVPDHSTRVLEKYGLMSQRHPEMDFFINAYLVANSQLSGRGQTSLQSQRRSSNMAVSLLELLDEHAVWIRLYSTGFLPGTT